MKIKILGGKLVSFLSNSNFFFLINCIYYFIDKRFYDFSNENIEVIVI